MVETRTDVLVAEARHRVGEWADVMNAPADVRLIARLADALEASEGGQHVESKHWAEVVRLRSENLRLRNESRRLLESSQSEPEYVYGLRERITGLNRELEAESAALVDQAEAWFGRLKRIRTAVYLLGDDEITGSARRWLETVLDTIVKELEES